MFNLKQHYKDTNIEITYTTRFNGYRKYKNTFNSDLEAKDLFFVDHCISINLNFFIIVGDE